jgi:hypothetical protein
MCSHPENTRPLEQKSGEGEICVALVCGNGQGVHTPPVNIPWLSKKLLKNRRRVSTPWLQHACGEGAVLARTFHSEGYNEVILPHITLCRQNYTSLKCRSVFRHGSITTFFSEVWAYIQTQQDTSNNCAFICRPVFINRSIMVVVTRGYEPIFGYRNIPGLITWNVGLSSYTTL